VHNDSSSSSKIVDFGTNRKRLILNSSLTLVVLDPFQTSEIRAFLRRKPLFIPISVKLAESCLSRISATLGSAESDHHPN